MTILFSKGCEYALQAVLFLASQPPNAPILQKDIARALKIPSHFLGKILQTLTRTDLIISQKGKTGGFILGRSPDDITLYDVIRVMDGSSFLDNCILGFPGCADKTPCPVHHQWKQAKQITIRILKENSIDQLAKKINIKIDFIKRLK